MWEKLHPTFLPRDSLHARAVCVLCQFCLSISMFVRHSFKVFSQSGSPVVVVFSHQTAWLNVDEVTLNQRCQKCFYVTFGVFNLLFFNVFIIKNVVKICSEK